MTEKKSMPRLELIIIIVFFISFLLWGMRKCSETKTKFADEYPPVEEQIDSSIIKAQQAAEKKVEQAKKSGETRPLSRLEQARREQNQEKGAEVASTRLYITIDGLKLRALPSLKGEVLDKFKLFDEVNFMNEVTDSTTELSLGKVMANEPWVKVKSRRGHIGWVYGAGVSYYKKKREGVQ